MPLAQSNQLQQQLIKNSLQANQQGVNSIGDIINSNSFKNDVLFLAYLYILESVQTDHDTAQIQAKALQSNATAQDKLIVQETQLNFYSLAQNQMFQNKIHLTEMTPNGVKVALKKTFFASQDPALYAQIKQEIQQGDVNVHFHNTLKTIVVQATVLTLLNTKNQRVSALRGVMEDSLTILRQNSQVSQANLNSVIGENQQANSEGAAMMQMVTALSNQIVGI